jgi:hypothetical protein
MLSTQPGGHLPLAAGPADAERLAFHLISEHEDISAIMRPHPGSLLQHDADHAAMERWPAHSRFTSHHHEDLFYDEVILELRLEEAERG